MKSRRGGASTSSTPRSSNLTTVRSVMDTPDTSCENLLEQLKYFAEKPLENLDMIVAVCGKLYLKLTSQDKTSKDKILDKIRRGKKDFYPLFLTIIEIAPNLRTISNVIGLMYESVNSKNVVHRNVNMKFMTELDATCIVGRAVIQHDICYLSEHIIQLVWMLGQMSWRDPRFLSKMRKFSQSGVKAFHKLLKLRPSHHSNIFVPTLYCLKTLTKSPYFSNVLVRDGIAMTLESILTNIGTAISLKLKLVLTIVLNLTKNLSFIRKLLKLGFVSHLMLIFDRWLKFNTTKKFKASHLVLCILYKIVVVSKSARSLISTETLHHFCLSLPDEARHYALVSKAFSIINICRESKTLPLSSTSSPVTFPLPITVSQSNDDDENDSDDVDDMDIDLPDDDLEEDLSDCEENGADVKATNKEMKQENVQHRNPVKKLPGKGQRLQQVPALNQTVSCSPLFVPDSCGSIFGEIPCDTSDNSPHPAKCTTCVPGEVDQASPESVFPLLMYYDHFREFGNLIPNAKENLVPMNCDVINRGFPNAAEVPAKARRTLRTLGNVASEKSGKSEPRLRSDNDGQKPIRSLRVLEGLKTSTKLDKVYQTIANRVNSAIPFVKIAYPDLHLISSKEKCTSFAEPLHVENGKNIRNKMLSIVERMRHPDKLLSNVLYDFDDLYDASQETVSSGNHSESDRPNRLSNDDTKRLGVREYGNSKALHFESRFECGNLRKAIQVGPYEYDIIMMPDVNSSLHHQWFYFEVSNMDSQVTYTFNIINQEKHHSQYQEGMKPLLFSVKEASQGRALWTRAGTDIFYYRNSYVSNRHQRHSGKKYNRAAIKNHHEFFYTLSFDLKFKHSLDVCYFAYHYPLTYSYMMSTLWKLSKTFNPRTMLYRYEPLCDSLNMNQVPVISLTACDNVNNRIEDRQLIVLSARVHPGESNASWLMDGILYYLISDALSAAKLRSKYVFKIVPMLNVEGVINGCHRCGLSNEDLNRKWKSPHPILHPEIFYTKGLIEFCSRVLKRPPYFYCDFHGHSKMKNIFLYGCSAKESWYDGDKCRVENPVEFSMLSCLLQNCSHCFDTKGCRYKVEKGKETTARVTVWREYGVTRSYTMESTYCGFDRGPLKDTHINIGHLREMGSCVCTALAALQDETQYTIRLIKNSGNNLSQDISRSRFKYMIDNSSHVGLGTYTRDSDEECDEDDEEDQN